MSKPWVLVGLVVTGLAVGAGLLTRYGPDVRQVAVGTAAPDFSAIDLATGDSVTLREHYHGAVTLVNVWATWCEPCRIEHRDARDGEVVRFPGAPRIQDRRSQH
jgi:cytochrome c biogenesis protein CcmG, thiol:disulfide interchange protein DsbE